MYRAVKLGIWLATEIEWSEEESVNTLRYIKDGSPVILAQTLEEIVDITGSVQLVEPEDTYI